MGVTGNVSAWVDGKERMCEGVSGTIERIAVVEMGSTEEADEDVGLESACGRRNFSERERRDVRPELERLDDLPTNFRFSKIVVAREVEKGVRQK